MVKFQDNLNGFRAHGVSFHHDSGNQAVGDCLFCGKDGHFYANKETKLWDCKRCGERGNFEDFLGLRAKSYTESIGEERLRDLAEDRGLPVVAFDAWGIGWTGNRYSIPILRASSRVADIRTFHLGGKLFSTPTCSAGLFNIRELADSKRTGEAVFLCEGEWDAISLRWLFSRLKRKGIVVGAPGAGTLKDSWIPFFQGRDVHVLYDNDEAGKLGHGRVLEKLSGTASSLAFLEWPKKGYKEGFDVRDLIKTVAVAERKPKKALRLLLSMCRPAEGSSPEEGTIVLDGTTAEPSRNGSEPAPEPISRKDLYATYKKWLHLSNLDALKVMFGVVFANKLEGDPVWLFLVAPPGGSKSELLMSISKYAGTHAISSLTPHTLISGASWKEGQDPSLLPQLKEKILIIKDFTTLLTMHYSVRDEIFGTLRDIYDGNTEKVFGNGIRRKYSVHFGILAGVTPAIETFNVVHQSLGERFLKFRISGNWDQNTEEDKILRALSNIGHENAMRLELQQAATRWMAHCKLPDEIPNISQEMLMRLVHLAKFSARLRGVVERDKFTSQVLYKPSSEVGTRIAKQLAKLGQGIAMFLEKNVFDEEIYKLVRRVALDTVPDRVEDIVRGLWELERGAKTGDLVGKTRLPQTTIFRVLQDMNLLRLVENRVAAGKGQGVWALSAKLLEHIEKGQIYTQKNPTPSRAKVTVKRG